jgi:hypothetical protein
MIVDNSCSIDTKEILESVSAHLPKHEFLVAQYDSGKKVVKTKVPVDRADWVIERVPPSRHLSISCATFRGKDILPNFSRTNIVSVGLDIRGRPFIRTPRHLLDLICKELDYKRIPLPSGLACSGQHCTVLWKLDREFEYTELSDLYAAEHGLGCALTKVGQVTPLQTASRYIVLPRSGELARPAAFIANSAISERSSKRLLAAASGHLTQAKASLIAKNVAVIAELGSLLHHRILRVPTSEHWYWMAAYAAATGTFVGGHELKEICRSIGESLANVGWTDLSNIRMSCPPYTYRGYVDVLHRNAASGEVRLGMNDYYPISDADWPHAVARALGVNDEEAASLGLAYLSPNEVRGARSYASLSGPRASVGIEEYVPLSTFLRAA